MRRGRAILFILVLGMLLQIGAKKVDQGFTIAILGDRTSGANDTIFSQVIEDIRLVSPDMVITVGDHIEGYTPDSTVIEYQWDRVLSSLSRIGAPVHLTPGNHDIWDDLSRRIYNRRIGAADKAFNYKGWLFVIFDVSNSYSWEDLPKEKVSWIERTLGKSPNQPKVVFYHKPFWAESFSAGLIDTLHMIFRNNGVKAVFTGHYHCYFSHTLDGIQYFSVCSSGGSLPKWGQPQGLFYGHLLVRFDRDSLIVKPIEVGLRRHDQPATLQDLIRIAEIDKTIIEFNEIRVDSRTDSLSQRILAIIRNSGTSTLGDTVSWRFDRNWLVEPKADYVEIPAGEQASITAFVRSTGPIYPVPLLEVRLKWMGQPAFFQKPLKIRRAIKAPLTYSFPIIDGVMTLDEWKRGEVITNLYGPPTSSIGDTTFCRIMIDSTYIYIGFDCRQSVQIRSYQQKRDGFAGYDDRVFVLFEANQGEFLEIGVNPGGVVFDRRIRICPLGTYVVDPRWDSGAKVSTIVHSGGWIAEMAIPLKSLGITRGSEIGFNMARYQAERKRLEAFQFPYQYDSDLVGILVLD